MDERNAGVEVGAEHPEIVKIGVPETPPVDEFDAELERGVGLADKFILVDAEHLVEQDDRRNGRFADPHGADLFRFD